MSGGTYVPTPEWLAADWHRACLGAGALTLQRCAQCGRYRHPPRRYCPSCAHRDAEFVAVGGGGTTVSKVVSYRSLDPGWAGSVPFTTLVVQLHEGPRLLAATRQTRDWPIGGGVRCSIEPRSDTFVLVWAEAEDASDR